MGKLLISNVGLMLILMLATHGNAMGTRPGPATITGTIRLVGNEPFAMLVLSPDDAGKDSGEHDYLLMGLLVDELRERHQGSRLTLEGNPCASPTPRFSRCFEPEKIVNRGELKGQ